ncbi:hypothetical protein O9Z70_05680 [Devosia sp. YIM 151766]|nr:hypothetical protein [Devosia sp. YIM 151766]WIY54018.1 hypothetical protein O9Z70_05680 [Devosia sp. YIM 151766]
MANDNDKELEFIGNFGLFAAALWILGAAVVMVAAAMGQPRV